VGHVDFHKFQNYELGNLRLFTFVALQTATFSIRKYLSPFISQMLLLLLMLAMMMMMMMMSIMTLT